MNDRMELSATQQDIRTALEKIIERTRNSFFECGKALAQIRDDRLYRDTHNTFEKYCEEKWGWKRDYAYKLISASEIVASLPVNVSKSIQTESVARAVAKVPESDRKAVVKEAAKSGPVTAPAIKAAAEKIATPPKAREEKPAEPVKRYDKVGQVIPDGILAEWDRATEIAAGMMKAASDNKCLVENGLADGDSIFAELSNSTVALLKNFHTDAKLVKPHAVCSTCKGIKPKTCTTCKKRGWLSDFYWSTKVPSDLRAMIEKQGKK